MKLGRIRTGIIGGLVALLAGCDAIGGRFMPREYQTGISVRKVQGSFSYPTKRFMKFKAKQEISYLSLYEFGEDVDWFEPQRCRPYTGLSLTSGQFGATPFGNSVFVQGQMFSFEAGLDFPLTPVNNSSKWSAGVYAGVIGSYADFNMKGSVGPVDSNVRDSLVEAGGKFGFRGGYKIDKNNSIVVSVFYTASESHARHADTDLSGRGAFLGWQISRP
jgi:hypothetical protein